MKNIPSESAKVHYLTESYLIASDDLRWQELDCMAWLSKNIYNAANYLVRQAFFQDSKAGIDHKERNWKKYLDYSFLYRAVRQQYPNDYYAELPPLQRRQKLSEMALLKSFRTEIA